MTTQMIVCICIYIRPISDCWSEDILSQLFRKTSLYAYFKRQLRQIDTFLGKWACIHSTNFTRNTCNKTSATSSSCLDSSKVLLKSLQHWFGLRVVGECFQWPFDGKITRLKVSNLSTRTSCRHIRSHTHDKFSSTLLEYLYFSSVLMLLVGRQEGHPDSKKPPAAIPRGSGVARIWCKGAHETKRVVFTG